MKGGLMELNKLFLMFLIVVNTVVTVSYFGELKHQIMIYIVLLAFVFSMCYDLFGRDILKDILNKG